MRILLTNDDGIEAGGLVASLEVARQFGDPVVVAPDECHSAKSHSVTMIGSMSLERVADYHGAEAYVCSGTPADCVRVALRLLEVGPIDVVISGINPGANAGVDVYYSGTVAAAREAALLGVPGIAVSQLVRAKFQGDWSVDWEQTRPRAVQALSFLLTQPDRLPRLTNVNLPAPLEGEPERGVKVCPLSIETWPMEFALQSGPDGGKPQPPFEFEYAGSYIERRSTGGTDFDFLKQNYITITPLRLEITDREALGRLGGDE